MKKLPVVLALFVVTLVYALPVRAWNATGHSVAAQIAWNNLDSTTKRKIIDALKTAPSDSRMVRLLPANTNNWPADVNDPIYEQLFQFIATWPDTVRPDRDNPSPTDKYHHGNWHYRDLFWNEDGSDSTKAPDGQIIAKLDEFDGSGSTENLAVQVAWIVHLVGDIHQPLHCSGRITDDPAEEDGDRGANLFCLAVGCREDFRKMNLHSYWDGALTRNYDHLAGESDSAYYKRLASKISGDNPIGNFSALLGNQDFSAWLSEGLDKAKLHAYPKTLKRNVTPSKKYRRNTLSVVESSVALGGYRLAKVLENKF